MKKINAGETGSAEHEPGRCSRCGYDYLEFESEFLPGLGVCEDCKLDDELVDLEDFEEEEFDEEDFC